MAKKKKKYNTKRKSATKNTRADDAARRVSYLWAASHLVQRRAPALSAFYNRTVKQIGRRINLSLDAATIKRHICKRCDALLDAGAARTRLSPRRQSHMVVTCARCGALRRYVSREAPHIKKAGKGPPTRVGKGGRAPRIEKGRRMPSVATAATEGGEARGEAQQSRSSCVAF